MRNRENFSARLLSVMFVVLFLCVSVSEAKEAKEFWRLDSSISNEMPRSFRLMTSEFSEELEGEAPSREGLDTLRCSASAQPSGTMLPELCRILRESAGKGAPIYMVDLRQESHGFVNGIIPVSWYAKRNWANQGLDVEAVRQDETERLGELVGEEETFVPKGKYDTAHLDPVTVDVETVETEQEIMEKAGLLYYRIAATDQVGPADDNIDAFVQFVRSLPKNAWLHFHCHAGHGRTTTFVVFYDIMNNPGVPLEEIVARQYALGGTDLFASAEGDGWKDEARRKRADIVRAFYDYANETRADGFRTPWSQWKQGK